jgi:hypothetical protein
VLAPIGEQNIYQCMIRRRCNHPERRQQSNRVPHYTTYLNGET